ncbi:uncharacterized protein LOC142238714 [Haematobia irritans]|uniref:uncharacterized protein LOC142238714 n=1 Tax=Haematobia irritans TaxID=7368 RepID=UPI003F50384F
MHYITEIAFGLTILVTLMTINQISAVPVYNDIDRIILSPVGAIDRLDEDYYLSYDRSSERQSKYVNSDSLKTGYYYIDNGKIIPVSRRDINADQRRDDSLSNSIDSSDSVDGIKFTPLVRYKETQTRRKKLFVPNFFG